MGDEEIYFHFEILKIYSNTDEQLNKLGQILTTPYSRKIYSTLIMNELTATDLGKIVEETEEPKLPNLLFHLNKMIEIGLIKTLRKNTKPKGKQLLHYTAVPLILIVPENFYEKAINSKTLKNLFVKIFKFDI